MNSNGSAAAPLPHALGDVAVHPNPPTLVIRNARLVTGRLVDVEISGDTVTAVVDARHGLESTDATILDADHALVTPGFVEPHAHLDKALTAERAPNPTGDLSGAIRAWLAVRHEFDRFDIKERALTAATEQIINGTTVIRSHVDLGIDIGLRQLEALSDVQTELSDAASIELVPLVPRPVTGIDGANSRSIARDAAQAGVAVALGGAPFLDSDPAAALHFLAGLAAEFGLDLDLHVDETLDPSVFTLPQLVSLAQSGFPGRINASHCVSLSSQPDHVQRRTAEQLAATGIGVITLPQTNLYLQGRATDGPVARGLPPVALLLRAGVTVAVGGDNVRDPFNPLGRNDPLESAGLSVATAHLAPDVAFEAITSNARAVLGLAPAGPAVGERADLVIIRAESVADAIATAPGTRTVLRAGRVVAESTRTAALTVDRTVPA